MSRTIFLSRLLGLYCLICGISMMVHRAATVAAAKAMFQNPGVTLILGVFVVAAGLAMILSHNVWSGGVLPVVVTISGWVALVKGLLFFFLTGETATRFFIVHLQYERLFYLYTSISLVLGLYLTYNGFRAPPPRKESNKLETAA